MVFGSDFIFIVFLTMSDDNCSDVQFIAKLKLIVLVLSATILT